MVDGVSGRSTSYFTHHQRVDHQNRHRHEHGEHDRIDTMNDFNVRHIQTRRGVDRSDNYCDHCQTDYGFLRSSRRTPHHCLHSPQSRSTPRCKKAHRFLCITLSTRRRSESAYIRQVNFYRCFTYLLPYAC